MMAYVFLTVLILTIFHYVTYFSLTGYYVPVGRPGNEERFGDMYYKSCGRGFEYVVVISGLLNVLLILTLILHYVIPEA